MAPLPSREVLESMRRADLQRLCKDYGVRANLRSEALIDLLLETQSVRQTPSPPPPPTRRVISTRRSSRAESSRTSSLIIHDIEEDEPDEPASSSNQQPSPPVEEVAASPAPPIRTRKAKDLQTSLGVGRPKAVGGAGPRAVTRPSSSQRSRKGKSSRMLSRVEPTIEEEPESSSFQGDGGQQGTVENPSSSTLPHSTPPIPGPSNGPSTTTSTTMPIPDLSSQISNAVEPLRLQLEKMQLEMRTLGQRNVEILELKKQLVQLGDLQTRYNQLEGEVQQLRSQSVTINSLQDEVKQIKEGFGERSMTPQMPSTPRPGSPRASHSKGIIPPAFKASTYSFLSSNAVPSSSRHHDKAKALPHPGFAATTLGKRPRDSIISDMEMSGIIEEDALEGEASNHVLRPNRKKQRLDSAEPDTTGSPSLAGAQSSAPRASSFSIYNDAADDFNENYIDAPPPTNELPDFFAPSSPLDSPIHDDSSNENDSHQPFNFSFVPISSTPNPAGPTSFAAPFPFPDPPHSPSPASTSLGYIGKADHRTDIFKSFGYPSPRRPRFPEATSDDTVNPASIAGPSASASKQRAISSNDVAVGVRLTRVPTSSVTDPSGLTDPPPAKKTMYGTELEGETRFGDFGVEGVASGFWSGR